MNISWGNNNLDILFIEITFVQDIGDVLGGEIDISVRFPVSTDEVLSIVTSPGSLSSFWECHELEASAESCFLWLSLSNTTEGSILIVALNVHGSTGNVEGVISVLS